MNSKTVKPLPRLIMLAAFVLLASSQRSDAALLGNPLVARQYTSDGASSVLHVYATDPVPEAGWIVGFETYKQADTTPYNTFNAYVLRPTGNANEYNVIFESGPLSVDGGTLGQVLSFPISAFAVQTGDLVAHWGSGIPADIPGEEPATTYYPAGQPSVTGTIVLGAEGYPAYQLRTYSFAAEFVVPEPGAYGLTAAAFLLLVAAGTESIVFRIRCRYSAKTCRALLKSSLLNRLHPK